VWHAVRVPTPAMEAARHVSRALSMRTAERTRWRTRIHGQLITVGVRLPITAQWRTQLAAVRMWDGQPIPLALVARVEIAWRHLQHVAADLAGLRAQQHAATRAAATDAAQTAHRLLALRGIGERFAWVLATAVCSRDLPNRRHVGALTGFTSAHYRSGTVAHDLGITRSGLAQVRSVAVATAWVWVPWQPESALTRWFEARFAHGGPRARPVGIVALARRLVIALWRYNREGLVPAGAVFNTRPA
jgi:transposase